MASSSTTILWFSSFNGIPLFDSPSYFQDMTVSHDKFDLTLSCGSSLTNLYITGNPSSYTRPIIPFSSSAFAVMVNIIPKSVAINLFIRLTPAACAALEWRRSRNGKDVAVPAMVMLFTHTERPHLLGIEPSQPAPYPRTPTLCSEIPRP